MASYFELKNKLQGGQTNGSTGKSSSSYFELKKRVSPVIEANVARLTAENERKKKEEQIRKSQEEAQRYQSEAGTGALIGNTLKGINPFSIQGLKNIGQGVANFGSAIINPIDTAKKIGGAVKNLATSSAQETAYDVFYQKGLDEQNLKTIQENNKKVLDLNEAIKNTQDEAEKEKLKRHAKIYLEFNQRLAEETGGELKDKTNLQLAGKALGTAMDLTPFLGFGSLGTKAGLKTLEKVGVKSAGKVLGRTLPKTGKELTKEAIIEGGLYGGLSGFGAGIEQKDPTIKSVGLSTAIGTGLGAGGGGVLSTIFSRLGSKAPRLKKAIDEGKIDESEIEKIFEEDGIAGVEEVIKPESRKLKAGEFAPISKEIQETTGKKLTAKETLEVKDKIEQGYTKEEIIDEIINPRRTEPTPKSIKTTPKRTELTSKPPKVESDIPTPEVDDIAEYVKNKSTKFRVADEGDDLVSQAKKMKSEGKSFEEFVKSQGTPIYHGTKKKFDSFDLEKSNIKRIEEFGGVRGASFTGNKKVAKRYANAPSNTFFDDSIIAEIKNKNKYFGDYVESLYKGREFRIKSEKEFERLSGGYSLTQANDIAAGIRGTKVDLGGEGVKGFGGVDFNENAANFARRTLEKLGLGDSIKTRIKTRYIGGSKLKDIGYIEPKGSKSAEEIVTEMSKKAKKDGFDGIIFETEQSIGEAPGRMSQPEFLIFEPNKLKTKSQLLDIWNKEQEKIGKATKKVTSTTTPTTKTVAKKGESITAKKLNEVMPDEYKINEDYDKITLKGELDRASKEIAKDKDEALRKAFSRDERVDRRIAKLEEFAQIAKDNKDYEAVNRLFTQANKIGTETAQGLNMLKALYAVNPEYKYMQDVINARLAKVKVGVKDIEKATKEVREIISRKGKDLKEKTEQAFKVKDAQELLNSIMCK